MIYILGHSCCYIENELKGGQAGVKFGDQLGDFCNGPGNKW